MLNFDVKWIIKNYATIIFCNYDWNVNILGLTICHLRLNRRKINCRLNLKIYYSKKFIRQYFNNCFKN